MFSFRSFISDTMRGGLGGREKRGDDLSGGPVRSMMTIEMGKSSCNECITSSDS